MTLLDFHDVHRSFGRGADVLRGVTFSVPEGQVLGLLGRNGAGKTTLLHIAMGMLRAQSGQVRVFGTDIESDPVGIKRRVGFLSEQQLLPPAMRVQGVIAFHRKLFPTWDKTLEHELLERFPLDLRARVAHLSKGQARQLGLLCAVAHRPELLLLDEPAGGLDPAARRQFLETSIQLLNESGTTIVFSSHHMTDVERMADRIVLLHDGEVLIDGALDELREDYTVAVMPVNGVSPQILREWPACLRVRHQAQALHAVFRGSPDAVTETLVHDFGARDASCRHVPLEELFVELLGADS